jgi:uncharacterized protein YkwD
VRTVGIVLLALACLLAAVPDAARARDRLLAPRGTCPRDSRAGASGAVQRRAMRCLHAYARRHAGYRALAGSLRLERAASTKAGRIVACRQFSHTPCGTSFAGAYRRSGYGSGSWSIAENIGWGSDWCGSARVVFARWLRSPEHRANVLRSEWRDIGIGRRRADRLFGRRNVSVWVVGFGRP